MTTPIRSFDTLLLQCSDMPRSLRFWRDALGLPFEKTDCGDDSFEAAGGVRILLHPDFDESIRGSRRDATVAQFQVDDADAWYEELRRRGVDPGRPPRDAPWGRFFGVSDPDGYRVSFVARR